MIEEVAGWLNSAVPGLDGYELLALQTLALAGTALLLVMSLLALARAGRLLSDTSAVRVRTDAVEQSNARLTMELQTMRERYAVLLADSTARRPQPGSAAKPRKGHRAAKTQPGYTRRYDDPRGGSNTVH